MFQKGRVENVLDASIVGVGLTEFYRSGNKSTMELAICALKEALEESGLKREDVDGVVTNIGWPIGVDVDQFTMMAGLNTRFANQTWTHGRFVGTSVSIAAMAVSMGLADVVACICATGFAKMGGVGGERDLEEFRPFGGSHGEAPHYGLSGPVSGAAMSVRRYMHKYGASSEDLAYVPITLRNHAKLNPKALRKDDMTIEDYHNSRFIAEPLHLFDCCQVTDGAACIIITRAERSKALKQKPVKILGMQGLRFGKEEFVFSLPGLGVYHQSVFDFKPDKWDKDIFSKTGIDPSNVDGLYTYDAFSPLVWYTLERFGFCEPGEAPAFVKQGNISLSGILPVNTNGGLLSEGHISGWNHIVELTRQLRGECGARQIDNASILQWATCFGDSILFGRD